MLSVILSLLQGQTKAQKYIPLLDTGKTWISQTYMKMNNQGQPDENGEMKYWAANEKFKLLGDTLLENIDSQKVYTYRKLYRQENQNTSWKLSNILREDTIQKKVYTYYSKDSTEGLLYDFSITSNMSIKLCNPNATSFADGCSRAYTCTTTDSVVINGLKRLRLTFNRDVWIEGIGSLSGLVNISLNPLGYVEYNLLCYYEKDKIVYHNPFLTDCYYTEGTITNMKELSLSKFNLEYNSQEQILLINSELDKINISIFDVNGRQLINEINPNHYLEIDCSKLTQGIYFYSSYYNNQFKTGTFIKQ